jgi:hypothetical protein
MEVTGAVLLLGVVGVAILFVAVIVVIILDP